MEGPIPAGIVHRAVRIPRPPLPAFLQLPLTPGPAPGAAGLRGPQLSSANTPCSWRAEGALPWAGPACPQPQEEHRPRRATRMPLSGRLSEEALSGGSAREPAARLGSAYTPERHRESGCCALPRCQARGQAVCGHPIYPGGVDFVLFPCIRQKCFSLPEVIHLVLARAGQTPSCPSA